MHHFYSTNKARFPQVSRMVLLVSMILVISQLSVHAQEKESTVKHPTSYRTIRVDGLSIFYREAGPKDAPTLLLLHGLPSSSRMFEPLFTRLGYGWFFIDSLMLMVLAVICLLLTRTHSHWSESVGTMAAIQAHQK
jgi:hypothetical protein